jgi:hypothetical protein
MTDAANDNPREELEPLDPAAGVAPGAIEAAVAAQMQNMSAQGPSAGLPSPAYNPRCTDKSSYKFLMCGVLMLLGCMMPFSANTEIAGYQTMSGAFFTFISIGMVWTWWSAIHHARTTSSSLKWIGLCMFPLLAQLMNLVNYDAHKCYVAATEGGWAMDLPSLAEAYGLKQLFADMGTALGKSGEAADAAGRCEAYFRCFGTGRFLLFLGALLTEVYFILGIVGALADPGRSPRARDRGAARR